MHYVMLPSDGSAPRNALRACGRRDVPAPSHPPARDVPRASRPARADRGGALPSRWASDAMRRRRSAVPTQCADALTCGSNARHPATCGTDAVLCRLTNEPSRCADALTRGSNARHPATCGALSTCRPLDLPASRPPCAASPGRGAARRHRPQAPPGFTGDSSAVRERGSSRGRIRTNRDPPVRRWSLPRRPGPARHRPAVPRAHPGGPVSRPLRTPPRRSPGSRAAPSSACPAPPRPPAPARRRSRR